MFKSLAGTSPCSSCRSFATTARRRNPEEIAKDAKVTDDGKGLSVTAETSQNPILEEFVRKQELKLKKKPTAAKVERPTIMRGGLGPSSIFGVEHAEQDAGEQEKSIPIRNAFEDRNRHTMTPALIPDPRYYMNYERKKVIRQVTRRGRLSRTEQIKQTEREHLSKSRMMKTSVKKLGMLARQIQGKPVDDAILQMRFSKKKVAQDVKKHLEYSVAEAVVRRGMGLGKAEDRVGEPVEIELKDGKRKYISDRTALYVDQAWVGRGKYGKDLDYRARGRINVMRLPHTSISVLLKEEATRVRLHEEAQEKRDNRKLWTQLPDRPIPGQSQYNLW